MQLRQTKETDIPYVISMYNDARYFMALQYFQQWPAGYPSRETLKEDRALGRSFVLEDAGEIWGTAAFFIGDEPNYRVIDGAWGGEGTTAVVHRLAVNADVRGQKVGTVILEELISQATEAGADWFRVDTHEDNRPMRGLLEKLGFTPRGNVTVEDGTLRIAYDLPLQKGN